MSIVYEPKGKAREYSPLAANFYEGCNHGCKYCYVPNIRRVNREQFSSCVSPRRDIIHELEKDFPNYANSKKQILFCFTGDPYCNEEKKSLVTRAALSLALQNKIPIAVLTKAGSACLRDINLFKSFDEHIQVGASLTFFSEKLSSEWEPGAATPAERIDTLRTLHASGIKTWASFEPVIDPAESIRLIKETVGFVDLYKVGKLNNFQGFDKSVDWTAFLESVVDILRAEKKPFFIKHDLRLAAPTVKLFGNEVLADKHCSSPWEDLSLF